MAYTLFCSTCSKRVYLGDDDLPQCPACASPLSDIDADRRRAPTTPEVRSWITQLRLNGGDFNERAATVAGRVAYRRQRAGATPEEVFEAARTAYYEALTQQGESAGAT